MVRTHCRKNRDRIPRKVLNVKEKGSAQERWTEEKEKLWEHRQMERLGCQTIHLKWKCLRKRKNSATSQESLPKLRKTKHVHQKRPLVTFTVVTSQICSKWNVKGKVCSWDRCKWPSLPALRAGGNRSRMARMNAEIRTFCLIWGCRCWAILPRHTVVLVLMPPCKKKAQWYCSSDTIPSLAVCCSPDHPLTAAWQSGAKPPHSNCYSWAWEQGESLTATKDTSVKVMFLTS